jgi:hypothetical protein
MTPGTICNWCSIREAETMRDGHAICPECEKELDERSVA